MGKDMTSVQVSIHDEAYEGEKKQQARTPESTGTNCDILKTQFYKIHAPQRKKNRNIMNPTNSMEF